MADDRSNKRHLATVLVDMWSKAVKSTIVIKRAWLDLERRGRGLTLNEIFSSSIFI